MKNYSKITLLATLLLFILVSCSKDPSSKDINGAENVADNTQQPLIQNNSPEESPHFELSDVDLSQEDALLNIEAVLNYNYARLVVSPKGEVKKYEYELVTNLPAGGNLTVTVIEDFYNTLVTELGDFQVTAGGDYQLHLVDLSDNNDGTWAVRAIFMDPLPTEDPLNTMPWDIRVSGSWKAPEQYGDCQQNPGVFDGAPEILDRHILHNALYINYINLPYTFTANPMMYQRILTAVQYPDPNAPQLWFLPGFRTMYYSGYDGAISNFWCIADIDMLYYYNKWFYTIIPTELGNIGSGSQEFALCEIRSTQSPNPNPQLSTACYHSILDLTIGNYYAAPGPPLNL